MKRNIRQVPSDVPPGVRSFLVDMRRAFLSLQDDAVGISELERTGVITGEQAKALRANKKKE